MATPQYLLKQHDTQDEPPSGYTGVFARESDGKPMYRPHGLSAMPFGGDMIAADWDINSDGLVDLAKGGTGANLSATGPGLLTQATVGGAITVGAPPSMRNILLNGTMGVWQRGTSSVTATEGTNTYRADRWGILATGGNPSVARSTTVPATGRSTYSLEVTGASGVSACLVSQRIEAINTPRTTVTFSAWVRVSSSRAVTFKARTPSAVDNWTTNTERATQSLGTIAANTWTYVQHTFDTSSLTDIANGLAVGIDVGNLTSGTFHIAEAQLEYGALATPCEVRGYGAELAACQRYYQQLGDASSMPIGAGFNISTTQAHCLFIWGVSKRVPPTISASAADEFELRHSGGYPTLTGMTFFGISLTSGVCTATTTGLTAGEGSYLRTRTSGTRLIYINSEL
jgi:hypothetical protein